MPTDNSFKMIARQILVQLPIDPKEAHLVLRYVAELVDAADAVLQDRRPDLTLVRGGGSPASSNARSTSS
jgi:hypothetical protein